jgi:hypothetical protein
VIFVMDKGCRKYRCYLGLTADDVVGKEPFLCSDLSQPFPELHDDCGLTQL